jgi:hypothetical protein
LELYNALNGTNYTDKENIEMNLRAAELRGIFNKTFISTESKFV